MGVAAADEEARLWTNSKGKSAKGVMVDKGEDWVKVKIKGKVHELPLATLSEKDRKYVHETELKKDLVIKTEVKSRRASDIDFDVRTLEVELKHLEEGRRIYGLIVWVSRLHTSGKTGVKSHVEGFYTSDGTYDYEASFSNNRKVGESYQGFALRLIDADGSVIGERASAKPYLKYLDQVHARYAPKPKKKKGKGGKNTR